MLSKKPAAIVLAKREIELDDEDKRWLKLFELEPITKEEDMKNWNGYIDPEGNFYRTKPMFITYWNGSANLHRDWGDAYMLAKGYRDHELPREALDFFGEPKRVYSGQDWLVYGERWLACTFDSYAVGITIHRWGTDEDMTVKQKETMLKLFKLNGFDLEKYYEICEGIIPEVKDSDIKIEGEVF